MQSKILRSLAISSFFLVLILGACTKIDTTTIGADLIPAVDNVHTFADTLSINTTQGFFNDTTKMGPLDNYVLGRINNDPVFGTTDADVYLQLKPPYFPYSFGPPDSLTGPGAGLDSVVLTLSYKGFFGDTIQAQHLTVYALDNNASFVDASYTLNYTAALGEKLGEASVPVQGMWQYKVISDGDDSVNYQIRIKLSDDFAQKLWGRDSTSGNTNNNAFHSDSLFQTFYRGFVIKADEGNNSANGLMYVGLADAKTRLEVHYRKKNAGGIDTVFANFPFAYTASGISLVSQCAHANNVQRDWTKGEIATPQADALYLQTSPGTYAMLDVPGLGTLSNRIIHRAELVLEQIPGDQGSDKIFPVPGYLYIDLKDTGSVEKFKPIYHDLNPNTIYNPDNSSNFFPSSGIDFNTFGGYAKYKTDPLSGRPIAYYTFSISRYVQKIVTEGIPNYKIRLWSPYDLLYYGNTISFNNSLAYGRIKIGAGNNSNYKMWIRIVYSNL